MGRASARLFAEEGATVFVGGRNRERRETLAKEITDAGGKAFFVELEVIDQEQWVAAVEQMREKADALHIFVNIVGSNALVMLPEMEIEVWNKMFEVNVAATLIGIRTRAPLIKDSGGRS